MIVGFYRYSKGWGQPIKRFISQLNSRNHLLKWKTFLAEGNDKEAKGKEIKGVFNLMTKQAMNFYLKLQFSSASTDGCNQKP